MWRGLLLLCSAGVLRTKWTFFVDKTLRRTTWIFNIPVVRTWEGWEIQTSPGLGGECEP